MQEDLYNGRLDGIHLKIEFMTRCGWLVPPTEVLWFLCKKRNAHVFGGDRRVLTDLNKQIIICDFILQVSFKVQVPEGYVRAFFYRGTLGNRGRFGKGRGKFPRLHRARVHQVHNAHNGNGNLQGLLSGSEGDTRGNDEEGGTI